MESLPASHTDIEIEIKLSYTNKITKCINPSEIFRKGNIPLFPIFVN
jgi:hypothetical protein